MYIRQMMPLSTLYGQKYVDTEHYYTHMYLMNISYANKTDFLQGFGTWLQRFAPVQPHEQ